MTTTNPHFPIRMARPDDVPECRDLDVKAWGEESAATADMLRDRITRYPVGNFVAIDPTGRIVGSAWTVAIDSAKTPVKTWWEVSGKGGYEGVVDMHGDVLYGVNLTLLPELQGQRHARDLVARVVEMGWLLGRKRSIFGARMPCYHEWSDVFSAEDYLDLWVDDYGDVYHVDRDGGTVRACGKREELRSRGGRFDPRSGKVAVSPYGTAPLRHLDRELAYFLEMEIGEQPCIVHKLLPGYFPDPPSLDNGVLIGWENPSRSEHR